MNYKDEYERWLINSNDDIKEELKAYDESLIEDAFYKDLSFGTGGLRGTIGAGTNRMNVHTVAKASQGLANYLKKHFNNPSVVIGYDSRIKSDVFAKTASDVFLSNGINVYRLNRLLPVPTVSYATRYLKASCGVMITASHNPSKYNGYKVYGQDGCQITTEVVKEILDEINKIDIFNDVLINTNKEPNWIKEEVLDSFISEIKKQSVLYGEEINKDVAIVYSPLNGTGLEPVTRVLKEEGYSNITIVEEQRNPDGNFPTCPYPNPEIKQALQLGLEYCTRVNADLMLATDPDSDRVGIAVKDNNEYKLLTGNEVGLLLLDYICSQKTKHNKLPNNPLLIKTIVTIDMDDRIAKSYGLDTINVLTGFKFIGEQIGFLENKHEEDRYVFGFEESYGYLTGTYVRDKDAVDGAYMIVEMFSYYKTRNISLLDKLNELYTKFGYCLNTLHSFEFEGSKGMLKMNEIMKRFHNEINLNTTIVNKKIESIEDYSKGLNGLPKSDVLKYRLQDNCSIVVRPSGTEPKLKVYISITANNKEEAQVIENKVVEELKGYFE